MKDGEATMVIALRVLGSEGEALTQEQARLRQKAVRLISEFGAQLLETPVSELRRMANKPCGDPANLFSQIWDRYHFVPTAGFLRDMGGDQIPSLIPFIEILDQVWQPVGEEL